MMRVFRRFFEPPTLKDVTLDPYPVVIALDRLNAGVDNIHYDVLLSRDLRKCVHEIVLNVLVRNTQTEDVVSVAGPKAWGQVKEQFQRHCREITLDGLNKAKVAGEVQIGHLALIAIIKLVLNEMREQTDALAARLKNIIRGFEASRNPDEALNLRKRMFFITENRDDIVCKLGQEIFQHLMEVQVEDLNQIRRIHFGEKAVIPADIFSNPMMYVEKFGDDLFILKEYKLLLGHRLDDSDTYKSVVNLVRDLLIEIYEKDRKSAGDKDHDPDSLIFLRNLDEWLKWGDNVDRLVNCFHTEYQMEMLKKKGRKEEIPPLRHQMKAQRRRLAFFYTRFRKAGLIGKIVAGYEMQSIYQGYCPPLVPHLISQFLTSRRARKTVAGRLKRMKKIYGDAFSLEPLYQKEREVRRIRRRHRKGYLIRFLKDFFRLHRDIQNYEMIRDAMEMIHLVEDEGIITLSRTNQSLYEFLLPHERGAEDLPIKSHVILKADIRGSTDITHRMMERELNPATYFSLNLFNPISELLSDFGARKVFVEGDAMILSIFERTGASGGFYSVARACGLGVEILSVVRQCNARNQKYRLPVIEMGIGVCYQDGKPAFLFDGDHRIMISSAINRADRLSGCSKGLKSRFLGQHKAFNLYVFQTVTDDDLSDTADDLLLRYNVSGIELNPPGFEKLKTEIELKPVKAEFGGLQDKKSRFYAGKYLLTGGDYRRLVIRESPIPRVDPESLEVISSTGRLYYEVISNPKIIGYFEKHGLLEGS